MCHGGYRAGIENAIAAVPRAPSRPRWGARRRRLLEWMRGGSHMMRPELAIQSRDYWVKIVAMLQQYWALVEDAPGGAAAIYCINDGSRVFDRIEFPSRGAAPRTRSGVAASSASRVPRSWRHSSCRPRRHSPTTSARAAPSTATERSGLSVREGAGELRSATPRHSAGAVVTAALSPIALRDVTSARANPATPGRGPLADDERTETSSQGLAGDGCAPARQYRSANRTSFFRTSRSACALTIRDSRSLWD